MKPLSLALLSLVLTGYGDCLQVSSNSYTPDHRIQIAGSVAKGERRANERSAVRRELCGRCNRPPVQCVCASLPEERIRTDTSILILQHPAEFRRKTFSTVPLIPLVLQNVQVIVGRCFEPDDIAAVSESLANGKRPLLLFPGPEALSLDDLQSQGKNDEQQQTTTAKDVVGDKNILILIDGTWTQAQRMLRGSPNLLERCQQVQFTADSSSIYDAVRKEPDAHCLSTLEAVAQTLLLLEPPSSSSNSNATAASHHLHAALQSLVDIQLKHTEPSISDPRFAHRADKAVRKKKRRMELEHELFGDSNVIASTSVKEKPRGQEYRRVDLGNDAVVRRLGPLDAPFVDSVWPFRSEKSPAMIQNQLEAEYSTACLGIQVAGELCACILRYRNGALGMLHVDEVYRRRGFGAALLAEATRVVKDRGEPCFAFIVVGNLASEQLFASQGWALENPGAKSGSGRRRAKRKWVKQ